MKWVGPPCILSKITLQIGRPFLATAPGKRAADGHDDAMAGGSYAGIWGLTIRPSAMLGGPLSAAGGRAGVPGGAPDLGSSGARKYLPSLGSSLTTSRGGA